MWISSKDTDKEHTLFTKNDNMYRKAYDETNEVIEESFESLQDIKLD